MGKRLRSNSNKTKKVSNTNEPREHKKQDAINTTKSTLSKDVLLLLNKINQKFGTNTITVGSSVKDSAIKRIPTGSIKLDIDLGGGIPIGRFSHISGPLSSTKTTQCLHVVRNAQKMGYSCAYIDVEGTLDKDYFESLGIDTNSLIYCRPDGLEEATQVLLDLQQSGLVQVGVWDSIEASAPVKELDSTMDETVQMGLKQKLIGEFLRKFQSFNNRLTREGKTPFTLIATNQLREKIGGYGDPEYYTGGRAIGFYTSVDIRFRKGDWITEGTGENKTFVGQIVKYKIEKNKTHSRMKSGEFDFYFEENSLNIPVGHNDNFKSVILLGLEVGLIEKGGAWFYLNRGTEQEVKFQGQTALVDFLREHPDLVEDFKEQILDLQVKLS